jgi:DNA adenine methylase
MDTVKPILKWVGGKTQILDKLFANFPTKINNYHEIFLGGGSVLLTLLSQVAHGKIKVAGTIHAYDINEPLIYVYKNIQTQHTAVYAILQTMIGELNACPNEGTLNRKPATMAEATQSKENYYYWCRTRYNKLSSEEKRTTLGSALFIFLNKTCFRGVFRVGPNGFNVPYGHYKNPEVVNKEHLEEVHRLIQNVRFECMDFVSSMNQVVTGDYVYLDPPYAPETATSFVGYTETGFGIEMHKELFALIHRITEKKASFMMSNADVELVRTHFPDGDYTTETILCKRSINSKNPESKTNEVIIKNY